MAADRPLEETIAQVVEDAVTDALAPYLRRLSDPECLTYSVPKAAVVLGVSSHTVRKLIEAGHLPLVPHLGERKLIPRAAVEDLVAGLSDADIGVVIPIGKAT